MFHIRLLFPISFILICGNAFSQRSKIEVVEIGIDQKKLSAVEWPFDLPFYLTGAITEDVQSVMFNYRIADPATRKKSWISFPHPDKIDNSTGFLTTAAEWKRGIGDNTKFIFLCDGLHPNIKYNFRFEVIRKLVLEDKLVAEMKSKLANELKSFFKLKANAAISQAELTAENNALKAIVQGYFLGKTLRFKSNPSTAFIFDAFDMTDISATEAFKASTDLFDALKDYNDAITNLTTEFDLVRNRILADIDAIQTGKLKMNLYSKETLALPFNPGLSEFKAHTLLDALKILRQMSLMPSTSLFDVLKGNFRITNNGFTETGGQQHTESILFITSVLNELNNKLIKDTVAGTERARFGYFSALMNTSIAETGKYIRKIIDAKERLAKVEGSIPEILSTIVQFEALESEVISVVDVVSEKTPYISAEAGISYLPAFSGVAHYSGANIYFVPIDKRAPLKSFRGSNRLLKSLCIQIGVSNFFGDRPLNTRSLLGKSSSTDLTLGLGYRINRIIKLNAGLLPYKTNNKNPQLDQYDLKAAAFFSIGLDVNLLKAFGDVAELLSL
jgi:hypothetical protein